MITSYLRPVAFLIVGVFREYPFWPLVPIELKGQGGVRLGQKKDEAEEFGEWKRKGRESKSSFGLKDTY